MGFGDVSSLTGPVTPLQMSWDTRPSRLGMETAWTTERRAANGTNERILATKTRQEGNDQLTKAESAHFYVRPFGRQVDARWRDIADDPGSDKLEQGAIRYFPRRSRVTGDFATAQPQENLDNRQLDVNVLYSR